MDKRAWMAALWLAVASGGLRAEIVLDATAEGPVYYAHPLLHSLVFVSPEKRAQAILPPAPVFVAPPPLIYRAPASPVLYPPARAPGFNQGASPSNRDASAYSIARAHAFSQDLYRKNGVPPFSGWGWIAYPGTGVYSYPYPYYGWNTLYPPLAPGLNHPSNRDNASYLIERAHRFSQDAYRRP
jgi:hypothetical protein